MSEKKQKEKKDSKQKINGQKISSAIENQRILIESMGIKVEGLKDTENGPKYNVVDTTNLLLLTLYNEILSLKNEKNISFDVNQLEYCRNLLNNQITMKNDNENNNKNNKKNKKNMKNNDDKKFFTPESDLNEIKKFLINNNNENNNINNSLINKNNDKNKNNNNLSKDDLNENFNNNNNNKENNNNNNNNNKENNNNYFENINEFEVNKKKRKLNENINHLSTTKDKEEELKKQLDNITFKIEYNTLTSSSSKSNNNNNIDFTTEEFEKNWKTIDESIFNEENYQGRIKIYNESDKDIQFLVSLDYNKIITDKLFNNNYIVNLKNKCKTKEFYFDTKILNGGKFLGFFVNVDDLVFKIKFDIYK
jgi:hypothetical protein